MADDLVFLDGRNCIVYGRPWRLELREGSRDLLKDPPFSLLLHENDETVDGKFTLNPQGFFETSTSSIVDSFFFLENGSEFGFRRLGKSEFLHRLGYPVCLWYDALGPVRGYRKSFEVFASNVQGFVLTIDHRDGILATAQMTIEVLRHLS